MSATPMDPAVLVPWTVGGGFILTRLHFFRDLRPYLGLVVTLSLFWRCYEDSLNEGSVSVLDYLILVINEHVRNPYIRLFLKDSAGALLLSYLVYSVSKHLTFNAYAIKTGIGDFGFGLVRNIPFVSEQIDKEKKNMEADLEQSLKSQCKSMGESILALPTKGKQTGQIIKLMTELSRKDDSHWETGKVSGSVYYGDKSHQEFLNKAFGLYSVANPLHPGIWPSLMKFESEVISMVANMMNGGNNSVVGCMTSGGTESIVMAVKTHRDYHRDRYGITEPEVICCTTAHAAVYKAGELLGVKVIRVPFDPKTFKIDLAALERSVGPNTVMMYASAPSFPHGVIDPIADMSDIACKYGIGLHVDCCLGGFILPFAKKVGGFDIPGKKNILSMSLCYYFLEILITKSHSCNVFRV
jgi:hypothetical protein